MNPRYTLLYKVICNTGEHWQAKDKRNEEVAVAIQVRERDQALVADGTIVQQARRHRSRHGAGAFLAMLVPAIGFPIGLFLLRQDPRFAWVRDWTAYPWEFWAIACCGTVATLGGAADWLCHR